MRFINAVRNSAAWAAARFIFELDRNANNMERVADQIIFLLAMGVLLWVMYEGAIGRTL